MLQHKAAARQSVTLCYITVEVTLCNMTPPRRLNMMVHFFYFARGLRRANKLSDADAACVTTALALC